MKDEEDYRRQARLCREEARMRQGLDAERWDNLADHFERLANGLRALRPQQPQKPDDEK